MTPACRNKASLAACMQVIVFGVTGFVAADDFSMLGSVFPKTIRDADLIVDGYPQV